MSELFPIYSISDPVRQAIISDMLNLFGNNVPTSLYEEEADNLKNSLQKLSDKELLEQYIEYLGYKCPDIQE